MDSSDSSERTCSIAGAIPWHTSSLNDTLQNFAVASIWLSQLMHSVLLVLSKVLMFFIICLLVLSFFLSTMWVRICVIASVTLAANAGDMLFTAGVCMEVLVLGWFVSW